MYCGHYNIILNYFNTICRSGERRTSQVDFSNFWYENSEYIFKFLIFKFNILYYIMCPGYWHLVVAHVHFARRIAHYNNIIIIRSVSYTYFVCTIYIKTETRDYAVLRPRKGLQSGGFETCETLLQVSLKMPFIRIVQQPPPSSVFTTANTVQSISSSAV